MSMIDPTTGLRTPLRYTPQGVGQQAALERLLGMAPEPLNVVTPGAAATATSPLASAYAAGAGAAPSAYVPAAESFAGLPGAARVAAAAPEAAPIAQSLGARLLGRVGLGGGASAGLGADAAAAEGAAAALAPTTLKGALAEAGGGMGALKAGAIGLGANYAAGKLFGTNDSSTLGQAGRGFIRGAGWAPALMGAATATGIGAPLDIPIAVVAGITGTIGAALDVFDAGKWFGGGKHEDPVNPDDIVHAVLNSAGLDPAFEHQLISEYQVQKQIIHAVDTTTGKKPTKDAIAAGEAGLVKQVGDAVIAQMQQQATTAQSSNPADLLAMQAAAQQTFAPIEQSINQNASLYADAMRGIMPDLPASYRGIANAQVANNLESSSRLADAYKAQAAITPVVQRLTQYQQDQSSYAAQLFQQQIAAAQAAQNGTATSPSSVQSYLQPTG